MIIEYLLERMIVPPNQKFCKLLRSNLMSYTILLLMLMRISACHETNGSLTSLFDGKNPDTVVAETFFNLLYQYDKNIRPEYLGDHTVVTVDFSVLNFGTIDEVGMTFSLDLFLRQRWLDYRLSHHIPRDITPLLGRRVPPDYIWTPDTVFTNAKDAKMHSVTVNNNKLDLRKDGTVFWGTRVTVIAGCSMDFRFYPMDIQTCNLTLQSYAYTLEHIDYEWEKVNPITLISSEMSQYLLVAVTAYKDTREYANVGTYSALTASFVFQRQVSATIIQLFFPATAIVSVSWVSLWIHKNCVSARIGLGVTTMLTICAFWGGVNRQLPRVNYVKAVDIYFIVSFCFILATLLEYTLVLNLKFKLWKRKEVDKKNDKNHEKRKKSLRRSVSDTSHIVRRKISKLDKGITEGNLLCEIDNAGRTIHYTLSKKEEKKKKRIDYKIMPYFFKSYPVTGKPDTLDVISRFMFPFMYFCFNVFFWKTYRHGENPNGDADGGQHL